MFPTAGYISLGETRILHWRTSKGVALLDSSGSICIFLRSTQCAARCVLPKSGCRQMCPMRLRPSRHARPMPGMWDGASPKKGNFNLNRYPICIALAISCGPSYSAATPKGAHPLNRGLNRADDWNAIEVDESAESRLITPLCGSRNTRCVFIFDHSTLIFILTAGSLYPHRQPDGRCDGYMATPPRADKARSDSTV
jgi:hypothetical protein